jgi:hypothetical protein
MKMTKKIICQNQKYQIEVRQADNGYALKMSLSVFREGIIISSKWFAYLRERFWFFGWHWRTVGVTTIGYRIIEWKEEYFPELQREGVKDGRSLSS